jgi:hypothetical protein
VTLNTDLLKINKNKAYSVDVWKDNKHIAPKTMIDGKITLDISANGLTAVAIDSIEVVPLFQNKITDATSVKWVKDQENLKFGGGTKAILFNFGADLQSVYTYTKANGDVFKKVILHYANDGKWHYVSKGSYPFEFTVSVPRNTREFKFRYEGITVNGKKANSDYGVLHR